MLTAIAMEALIVLANRRFGLRILAQLRAKKEA